MKRFLAWLMTTKIYKYFLKHVIPYIRTTTYYPKFNGRQFEVLSHIELEPADVFVTLDNRKLTGLLIKGWDHAAMVIDPYNRKVIQMTHNDCTIDHVFDLCKESDHVMLLRPKLDENYKWEMCIKAMEFRNAKYDGAFDLGVEALYCSELIYQADFQRRLNLDLSDLAGLGKPYISPTGLAECKDFEVIFDSREIK